MDGVIADQKYKLLEKLKKILYNIYTRLREKRTTSDKVWYLLSIKGTAEIFSSSSSSAPTKAKELAHMGL